MALESDVSVWPGGPVVSLHGEGAGAFADSMLLADFAAVRCGRPLRAVDLGCGCGTLAILLAQRLSETVFTGVERRAALAARARSLAIRNGLEERLEILCGDLREPALLPVGSFDLVVMNPPYFQEGCGAVASNGDRDDARRENYGTLEQWFRVAGRILRNGGRLFLCQRAERLSEVLVGLEENGIVPKWIRCVHHAPGYPARLILVGGQKQAGAGLVVEAPLYRKTPDGEDSPEIKQLYHREETTLQWEDRV